MEELPDLSSFPLDERGHIGRECPEEDCEQLFSMKLVDGGLPEFHYCPSCGGQDDFDAFWTPDQLKRIDSILGEEEEGCGTGPTNFEKPQTDKPAEPKKGEEIYQYTQEPIGELLYCDDCDAEFGMEKEPNHCPYCGGIEQED